MSRLINGGLYCGKLLRAKAEKGWNSWTKSATGRKMNCEFSTVTLSVVLDKYLSESILKVASSQHPLWLIEVWFVLPLWSQPLPCSWHCFAWPKAATLRISPPQKWTLMEWLIAEVNTNSASKPDSMVCWVFKLLCKCTGLFVFGFYKILLKSYRIQDFAWFKTKCNGLF